MIAPRVGGSIARAVLLICIGGACTDDTGPRLESAAPSRASAGAIITIAGQRLCGDSGDCEKAGGAIRIGLDNPVQANIVGYSDTVAMVRIPDITPIGKTVFVATVNDRASNALDFEVLPMGAITAGAARSVRARNAP